RPPRPEPCGRGEVGPGLARVRHPEQLEVGVLEEEAAAGRALARMRVGRALGQAEPREARRLRRALRAADEDVIERVRHGVPVSSGARLARGDGAEAIRTEWLFTASQTRDPVSRPSSDTAA